MDTEPPQRYHGRWIVGLYNEARTHQALNGNQPDTRDIEPPDRGKVIAIPQVGGLHHRYLRVAA